MVYTKNLIHIYQKIAIISAISRAESLSADTNYTPCINYSIIVPISLENQFISLILSMMYCAHGIPVIIFITI